VKPLGGVQVPTSGSAGRFRAYERDSPSGQGTVVRRRAEEHDVRAYQRYQRTFRSFS
jgi:hypothetical protein